MTYGPSEEVRRAARNARLDLELLTEHRVDEEERARMASPPRLYQAAEVEWERACDQSDRYCELVKRLGSGEIWPVEYYRSGSLLEHAHEVITELGRATRANELTADDVDAGRCLVLDLRHKLDAQERYLAEVGG